MTDTQKLDALDKLIAAVEVGERTVTHWRDFAALPTGDQDNPSPILAHRAYHGSLDAALALHNALLPGWVAKLSAGGAGAGVTKWHCTVEDWNEGDEVNGDNQPSTARAWLLAILKACRAQVAP